MQTESQTASGAAFVQAVDAESLAKMREADAAPEMAAALANCVSLLALIRRQYLRPTDLPHTVDAAILEGRAALARARGEQAA